MNPVEVFNLRMFLQEKLDGSSPFVSAEGTVNVAGTDTAVSFTVNNVDSIGAILTGDAVECKANALGARSYLPKKESCGLLLHGLSFTGKTREVTREGEEAPTTYHDVRFARVEVIVGSETKVAFRKVAARAKVPQAQASA